MHWDQETFTVGGCVVGSTTEDSQELPSYKILLHLLVALGTVAWGRQHDVFRITKINKALELNTL